MSSCSSSLSPSQVHDLSPLPPPTTACRLIKMLDSAAEQMMVHRDFQGAFDMCQRSLESLGATELEDIRCAELKAGFCILGIQALAELNQWPGVLSWVMRQYEEDIPVKILQMCILLYSKVGEPAVMQEATRVWLHRPSRCESSGFRTVAELYLLNILVPLGLLEEAREFVAGEVGSAAFEERKQSALELVEERARQREETILNTGTDSESHAPSASSTGALIHKLDAMLRILYRKFITSGSGFFPLRRLFLVIVLLYLLLFRLDPALSSSFMWISKLLQLLKQMWKTLFASHLGKGL